MLYERWQKITRDRRREVALRDLASGRCWTFAQLERAAETPAPSECRRYMDVDRDRCRQQIDRLVVHRLARCGRSVDVHA